MQEISAKSLVAILVVVSSVLHFFCAAVGRVSGLFLLLAFQSVVVVLLFIDASLSLRHHCKLPHPSMLCELLTKEILEAVQLVGLRWGLLSKTPAPIPVRENTHDIWKHLPM